MALDKLAHGSVGVALITEREAELLLQNQEVMSEGALAAVVVGANLPAAGRFEVQQLEVPCRNQQDVRILVRAQMINLGNQKVKLAGENSIVTVQELDAAVLACEMVQKEISEWDEVAENPLKYLRRKIPSLDEAIFASWSRRCFIGAKPTPDARAAETVFIMLRIKKQFKEAVLKYVAQGIYFSPRTEDNHPDNSYKVVWFPDTPREDILVKANTEPSAMGLVRNRTGYGIRVKSAEFSKLKQKWIPSWKPLADTPYDLKIQKHFDLQNMPVCCSKAEVQKFINDIGWQALVIKQVQPKAWLVGAEQAPANLVHLASHGTVLISEKTYKGKGKSGGKGKTRMQSREATPWLVATPSMMGQPRALSTMPPAMQVDGENGPSELEDRLQKKIEQIQREQQSSYATLKEDFEGFKKEMAASSKRQEATNLELRSSVQTLADGFTAQLAQQTSAITAALTAQRSDITKDVTMVQKSFKEELMGEVRAQIGTMRKRTPSPSKGSDTSAEPKKPKQ